MQFARKGGILAAASTLVGSIVFASLAATANAAPVAISIDDRYVAPDESIVAVVSGCAVGSQLTVNVNNNEIGSAPVTADPTTVTVAYDDDVVLPGQINVVEAICTPAPATGEAETTASAEAYAFGGSWSEADPQSFQSGETVTLTAGDFLPGAAVTLSVYPSDDHSTRVFSKAMGTAGDDFSVTADVVFPTELECGDYDVVISDGTNRVDATLTLCNTDTPTATPTATATTSPSATSAPTKKPTKPGLPHTGN